MDAETPQTRLHLSQLSFGYIYRTVTAMWCRRAKVRELEGYCRSVLTRQHATIRDLYAWYENDVSKYEEIADGMKSCMPRRLLSNRNNVGWVIAHVGEELFKSRPATLPYVLIFLEFVVHVYKEINDCYPWMDNNPEPLPVPLPIFTYSATLALAKTSFSPPNQSNELCAIL